MGQTQTGTGQSYCQAHICGDLIEDSGLCSICGLPPAPASQTQPGGQSDSYLRCSVCGRESTTNFSSSLRHGWEKCCGYTMTLVRTDADIDAAVGDAFAPVRKAIDEARR